jgi:hypothetical protein
VEGAQIATHRGAHHDVVEMGDDKIGVVDVHIQPQAGENKPGQAPNREQTDAAQNIP